MKTLPDNDEEEIFGFNDKISSLHQRGVIYEIFQKVNELNSKRVPINNPLNIETKNENDLKVKDIAINLLKNLPKQFSKEMIDT